MNNCQLYFLWLLATVTLSNQLIIYKGPVYAAREVSKFQNQQRCMTIQHLVVLVLLVALEIPVVLVVLVVGGVSGGGGSGSGSGSGSG